jgi:hypothetical protein
MKHHNITGTAEMQCEALAAECEGLLEAANVALNNGDFDAANRLIDEHEAVKAELKERSEH